MADISSFKPHGAGGTAYNFKDATARTNITTLSNSVTSLGNRVTALENAGGGLAFWVTEEITDNPSEYWGISDCDFTAILEESVWDYDDNDQATLYTRYPTYTYYNDLMETNVRVGNAKVGDIIIVNEFIHQNFYGNLPADTTIGYVNNSSLLTELDSRYEKQTPPSPDPSGDVFSVHGSGNYINFGSTTDRTTRFYYIVGIETVTQASEEFSGKTNTYKLAKCFMMNN